MFSSDARERHGFYDLAMDQLRAGLQDPSVIARLGSFAAAASNLVGDMVLADQKHGILTIPRKLAESNTIPIAIVRPGEEFILGETLAGNSPIQIRAMRSQINGWGPKQGDRTVSSLLGSIANDWQELSKGKKTVQIPGQNPAYAYTVRRNFFFNINSNAFGNLGKNSRRSVIGRPLITLILDSADPHPVPSRPLLHETVHAMDAETSPIWPADEDKLIDYRLRRELRGYHFEWFYCLGLHESQSSPLAGNDALTQGHIIEALRQQVLHKRKDQFEPLGALKVALQKLGLDEIYVDSRR